VADKRKQAVSVRIGGADLRNIKRLAQRLSVRDSDVIRFAIKSMLNRISPLCDPSLTGRNLMPVFVEFGDELIRFFELDGYRLEDLINERATATTRVDADDVALLAMSGLREQYLVMRMNNGTGIEAGAPKHSLRMYLYEKYICRHEDAKFEAPRPAAEPELRSEGQRPAA
jgi:hypothetical protein